MCWWVIGVSRTFFFFSKFSNVELLIIVSIERTVIAYKEEKKGLADEDNKKRTEKCFYGFISLPPTNVRHNRPKEFRDKRNISFDELKRGSVKNISPRKFDRGFGYEMQN